MNVKEQLESLVLRTQIDNKDLILTINKELISEGFNEDLSLVLQIGVYELEIKINLYCAKKLAVLNFNLYYVDSGNKRIIDITNSEAIIDFNNNTASSIVSRIKIRIKSEVIKYTNSRGCND